MMKKSLLLITLFIINFCFAQKVAYVDSKYILSNIPEFTASQEEIEELSKKWENEIQNLYLDIEKMYKSYQAEKYLLPEKEKKIMEENIINKEKEVREYQKSLFGPNGKLYEKQREKIEPIQENIYKAIQEYAKKNRYEIIFDKSSELIMLYSNEDLDISNDILDQLGYNY
jgi:outer membrane protein